MNTGAVGALRHVKAAIAAARLVMERTVHTLLVGLPAAQFAMEMGLHLDDLSTDKSKAMFSNWCAPAPPTLYISFPHPLNVGLLCRSVELQSWDKSGNQQGCCGRVTWTDVAGTVQSKAKPFCVCRKKNECQPNFRRSVSPDPAKQCGPYHQPGSSPAARWLRAAAASVGGGDELTGVQGSSQVLNSLTAGADAEKTEGTNTLEGSIPNPSRGYSREQHRDEVAEDSVAAAEAEQRPSVDEHNHDTIAMVAVDEEGIVAAGASSNGANHKVLSQLPSPAEAWPALARLPAPKGSQMPCPELRRYCEAASEAWRTVVCVRRAQLALRACRFRVGWVTQLCREAARMRTVRWAAAGRRATATCICASCPVTRCAAGRVARITCAQADPAPQGQIALDLYLCNGGDLPSG